MNKGFTLIELLIVMSVIFFLLALVIGVGKIGMLLIAWGFKIIFFAVIATFIIGLLFGGKRG